MQARIKTRKNICWKTFPNTLNNEVHESCDYCLLKTYILFPRVVPRFGFFRKNRPDPHKFQPNRLEPQKLKPNRPEPEKLKPYSKRFFKNPTHQSAFKSRFFIYCPFSDVFDV